MAGYGRSADSAWHGKPRHGEDRAVKRQQDDEAPQGMKSLNRLLKVKQRADRKAILPSSWVRCPARTRQLRSPPVSGASKQVATTVTTIAERIMHLDMCFENGDEYQWIAAIPLQGWKES